MPRSASFSSGAALAVALVAVLPGVARAQLRTCLELTAPQAEAEAMRRVLTTEIDRHPSHRSADTDCQGYLAVEVIDLGPQEGKWLTARINAQVPHRERIGPDGVVPAVERLLRVALANDPLVLRGPESNAWLKRQGRALELRSVTHYGAEMYALAVPVGSSVQTLTGVGLSLRREVSALHVGFRLGGAFDPGDGAGLRLRTQFDAQIEAALYAAPEANVSLFASALMGLVHQRFAGPAPLDGPDAIGTATNWGLSFALRGGVEALRTADVRVVGFLQLEAPAFVSADADHGVVDQWVPSALLGGGVMF